MGSVGESVMGELLSALQASSGNLNIVFVWAECLLSDGGALRGNAGVEPGWIPLARLVSNRRMTIVLSTPAVDDLAGVVGALRGWQCEGSPMQLHPGDVGWFWRFGAVTTAAAVRTWSRDGRILAVGLLDGPDLLRMTMAPGVRQDEELAHSFVRDVTVPGRGVLPAGRAFIEAPTDAMVQVLLFGAGWSTGEPWTPLHRGLTAPVDDPGMRVEVVGADGAHLRTALQRASFEASTFTDDRWQAMAAGLPYADARCLVGFDGRGNAVAAVTVWSAGVGRPGLLEPMGVHPDHRGHGFGRAISLAAAAALQELGSSSAIVCTPGSNVGGVAAYRSAGFQERPAVRDRFRDT